MSLSFDKLTPDEQAKLSVALDELRAATVDRRITWGRRAVRHRHGLNADEFSWEGASGLMVCVGRNTFEVFNNSGRRIMDLVLRDDTLYEIVRVTHEEYLDRLIDQIMEDLK